MGCLSGSGDDDAKAVFRCVFGKLRRLIGRAVCGHDMDFIPDPEALELGDRVLNNGQVTIAAHDDGYFFHVCVWHFPGLETPFLSSEC